MFGTFTYHGMPANRWKDDTHIGILTHCLTPPCQEGEAAATGPPASQSRNVRLSVRLEVNILPTQDHATPTSKPSRRHTTMASPRQPPRAGARVRSRCKPGSPSTSSHLHDAWMSRRCGCKRKVSPRALYGGGTVLEMTRSLLR